MCERKFVRHNVLWVHMCRVYFLCFVKFFLSSSHISRYQLCTHITHMKLILVPQLQEDELTDAKVVKMLFSEAHFNILYGNYPSEMDDAALFAAVNLHLEKDVRSCAADLLGESAVENTEIPCYLDHVTNKKWCAKVLELRSLIPFPAASKTACYLFALERARSWNFYGSTVSLFVSVSI